MLIVEPVTHKVTALYMACMLGPMDAGNVELVKLLIEAGADPNIPAVMTITPDPDDSDSDDGWVPPPKQWSPLILAVSELDLCLTPFFCQEFWSV